MRAILAMVCAAGLGASSAAAQVTGPSATGCAVVPILRAAVPVVEVKIGGKGPYRFAIDTGAEGHGRITRELAAELGLTKIGEVETPGNSLVTRAVFAAPEVSVGQASFKNLDLVTLPALRGPGADWDGVLGNALLELLPLTLDYGNARARFGGAELSEGLLVRFDRGVPILPVDIAGTRFDVHFDSGNTAAPLFLDEQAARALPLGGEPVARTRIFGDPATMEAPLAASVTIDGAPLSIQAIGWPSPRAGGNLGSRGMAGMSVTIDAPSQLAQVERSGRAPRCPD